MARPTILIVDDNAENRRILGYRLEKLGACRLVEATSGREALAAMGVERPDLVFMDMKMGDMDGWEATRRIRAMEDGRAVRIVALTAGVTSWSREDALAAGCDDYMTLPLVSEEPLKREIERLSGRCE